MPSPSHLSSLLVRDGVVSVNRMEQAFQRLVIYGGALDTVLLEMGSIPEDKLIQYLALATGLAGADKSQLEYFDPRAVQICPLALAEEYRVAPIAFEAGALRVLVTDPVDHVRLDALATLIGWPISAYVVPEYRFHLLMDRLFGIPTPARFASLAHSRAQALLVRRDDLDTVIVRKKYDVRRVAKEKPSGPMTPTKPPVSSAPSTPTHEESPLSTFSVLEAHDILAEATDRDAIFTTLLGALRRHVSYAALLVVHSDRLAGRLATGLDSATINKLSFSLEPPSVFRTVVKSGSPYIGPMSSDNDAWNRDLERLGGVVPPSALVLPIVIRDRTVALAYGHRGTARFSGADVAAVLPLAGDVALALSRLIVKGREKQPPPRAITVPASPVTTDSTTTTVATTRSSAQLLDDYEEGGDSSQLLALLRGNSTELLMELSRRFPGTLLVDRYHTGGHLLPASAHGRLLAFVVRLGAHTAKLVPEWLRSGDREVRYYATVAAAEMRAAVEPTAVVSRLFDVDYGVRAAALLALQGYRNHEIDAALEPVRHALYGDDAEAQAAAVALRELRHARAIPDLIESLDRERATAEEVHRALVFLCKQDFGTKQRKWWAWWEKNQKRTRIEWLLDGLAHDSEDVRLSAGEELKRISGEHFGFRHDGSRREREEARRKWHEWWEAVGKSRFAREPS